jgi:hypothetical protein
MPQRVHCNIKTSQLSLSLQISTTFVLKERQGEGGGRNWYMIPRALSRTVVWGALLCWGKGIQTTLKNIKNLKFRFIIPLDFWKYFWSMLLLGKWRHIKSQSEQNLFHIRRGLPLPYLHLMIRETSKGAHYIRNWEF